LRDENIKIFSSLNTEVDQYQLSTQTTLKLFIESQNRQIETLNEMVEKAMRYGWTIHDQFEEYPETAKRYWEKLTQLSKDLKV